MKRDIFQAIADPTRRAIITLIAVQAMTPTAMAEHFNMTRQAVSKHVKVLIDCKLVKLEETGRENYYHLNAEQMKALADWLDPLRKLWEDRFDQLDDLLTNS